MVVIETFIAGLFTELWVKVFPQTRLLGKNFLLP